MKNLETYSRLAEIVKNFRNQGAEFTVKCIKNQCELYTPIYHIRYIIKVALKHNDLSIIKQGRGKGSKHIYKFLETK